MREKFFKIGLSADYSQNTHRMKDYAYNGDNAISECCDFYHETESSSGYSINFLSEYSLSENMAIGLRIGYFSTSVEFISTNMTYMSLLDQGDTLGPHQCDISWNLPMDFSSLSINPEFIYYYENFNLNIGLKIFFAQAGHKKLTFNILEPGDVRFQQTDDPEIVRYENNDRTIILNDSELDDELKTYTALTLGFGYNYNINDRFAICPEAGYVLPLGEMLDGGYKISSIKFGLAFKYALYGKKRAKYRIML